MPTSISTVFSINNRAERYRYFEDNYIVRHHIFGVIRCAATRVSCALRSQFCCDFTTDGIFICILTQPDRPVASSGHRTSDTSIAVLPHLPATDRLRRRASPPAPLPGTRSPELWISRRRQGRQPQAQAVLEIGRTAAARPRLIRHGGGTIRHYFKPYFDRPQARPWVVPSRAASPSLRWHPLSRAPHGPFPIPAAPVPWPRSVSRRHPGHRQGHCPAHWWLSR